MKRSIVWISLLILASVPHLCPLAAQEEGADPEGAQELSIANDGLFPNSNAVPALVFPFCTCLCSEGCCNANGTCGIVNSLGNCIGITFCSLPPPVIDEIRPPAQRVGEMISIRGSGFGAFSAFGSRVRFLAGGFTFTAPVPYTWRDDFIRVRVPAGDLIGGVPTSLPTGPVSLVVVNGNNTESVEITFEVEGATGGGFDFAQRTQIVDHMDVSDVLAPFDFNNDDPHHNKARTKDAEVGDINGDGYPDILDNNSSNETNSTHSILRTNNKDDTFTFTSIWLEPLNAGDIEGSFASTVPGTGNGCFPGDVAAGCFFGDGTSYDADFADIDNDSHADILQAVTEVTDRPMQRIRILMNNQPTPGRFAEDTFDRMPEYAFSGSACPDDIAHGDLDGDGWIDFAVTLRGGSVCVVQVSQTRIFLNKGASGPGHFDWPIILAAPDGVSSHDVFFVDFNKDMAPDIVVVNELVPSQLFRNTGNFANPNDPDDPAFILHQELDFMGFAGDPADLNNDGAMDFVLVGEGVASAFLNDPASPGNFTNIPLLPPDSSSGALYDVELGDIDLDGDVDIVVAASSEDYSIFIWRNDGEGDFVNITAGGVGAILYGIGSYQRLSADLIDYDMDGDLDLYITGADGQDVGSGRGMVPNQLFENQVN